jgi:hypothetical protein
MEDEFVDGAVTWDKGFEKPARPIGEVSKEFLPSREGNAASGKELMSIAGMCAFQVPSGDHVDFP